jgi:two-component system chemotaxis response regulator CheY
MSHILIVDDSPTIRRMVQASLAPIGVEFIEAASGLEAIERLALGPIQLMVLDLNMPDMHGLEVLGSSAPTRNSSSCPCSCSRRATMRASRTAAMQAGATSYLTKPFTPQALLAEARGLIERAVEGAR